MEIKRPIGEKGQVVIPKDIRNFLELEKGNNVLFLVENNEIKIKKDLCSPIKQPEPQLIEQEPEQTQEQEPEIPEQDQEQEVEEPETPQPEEVEQEVEELQKKPDNTDQDLTNIKEEDAEVVETAGGSTFSPRKILKNFFDSSNQSEQLDNIKKSIEADRNPDNPEEKFE